MSPGTPAVSSLDVLELALAGFSPAQIAAEMHLSKHTVMHHLDAHRRRYAADSLAQLVALAWAERYGRLLERCPGTPAARTTDVIGEPMGSAR